MNDNPQFPEVTVQLSGIDGNAFGIIGRVTAALRKAGVTPQDIEDYNEQAMSGDYNNLLRVTMRTVNVR